MVLFDISDLVTGRRIAGLDAPSLLTPTALLPDVRRHMSITRRSLLAGGAAAATVGAAVGMGAAAGPARAQPSPSTPARIPTVREDHRAIVVGSGFGGGVAALRLTQAGVQVTLLERGIRWPTGPNARTFPEPGSNLADKRLLWFGTAPEALRTLLPTGFPRIGPVPPYPGLIDAVVGDTITFTLEYVRGGRLGRSSAVRGVARQSPVCPRWLGVEGHPGP
jgi:hypothetical protein